MSRLAAILAFIALVCAPASAAPAGLGDNADSVAVVVGNQTYRQTSPVDYAGNDADAMKDFLVRGLGFQPRNVIVLKDATLNELNQVLGSEENPTNGRLWRSVVEGKSNVFVYYSGHGVPDLKTRQPFLLPQDGDPNAAESGYALETLYKNLELVKQKVGADRQVIVMVDACFTGETGRKGENMLSVSAPGFAPAKPKAPGGVIRLAATSGATPANWDDQSKLGLFTSRFLMGAAGLARPDAGAHGRVDWADLRAYVTREVEDTARRDSGREQEPEIDVAALSLPAIEPAPAVKAAFDRARDEALWRAAERDGSREALERYVGECGRECAYRGLAMDRLLKRQQSEAVAADHETWRRLSAERKYRDYLDQCGPEGGASPCAYRQLALGYLGETAKKPDGGVREGVPAEEPVAPPGPAGNDEAKAFEAAKAASTVAAFDAFMKTYPKSVFRTQARGLRAILVKREAEKARSGKQTSPGGPVSGDPAAKPASRRSGEPTDAEIRAIKPTPAEWAAATRRNEARKRQLMEEVRPEYNRRMMAQGQAAANAWLKKAAFAIGQREAFSEKRRILLERRAAGR